MWMGLTGVLAGLHLTIASVPVGSGVPAGSGLTERGRCDGEGEGPYRVVELRSPDASLVLFGARHRTDPGDPILAEMERRLAALSPTVILVEGATGPVDVDRQTSIMHGGEMGLLCWLASQRGIPCRSADLTEPEEARRLLRRHSPEEVLLFLTVRVLAYFNPRPASQRPPGDLVTWAIHRYAPLVGLPPTITADDLARICERALHRRWRPSDVTTDWHDPRKDDLLTQRMSRESNELREPYMLEQMLDSAGKGARVFVALGEGHVCNVGVELRALWEEKRPGAAAKPR
jgi:hypothetical protein